jgi:DnaK suppressor protein
MTLTHKTPTVGPLGIDEQTMLRELLEQQREFRLDQLSRLGRGPTPTRPRTAADVEVDRSLRAGAESALADVERAIARMRAGTYGQCLRCGAALAFERLEILPHVALCMPCQRTRDGAG